MMESRDDDNFVICHKKKHVSIISIVFPGMNMSDCFPSDCCFTLEEIDRNKEKLLSS